jgi:hypothetical protein
MKTKRILAVVLFCPTIAAAQPSETPAAAPSSSDDGSKTFGVGYKLGDGIGVLGGDVIIHPAPHLTFDLYAAFMPVSVGSQSGTIYAAAPAIQTELFDGQRSTPYGAIGMQWASLTLGGATASGYGAYANIGYEWKWKGGFGIQLGGGVQYLQKVSATDSQSGMTYETGGKLNPNLELGLRYMFL